MPADRPYPSEPDGPRQSGKTASGRRGRRQGVEVKPGTVKQARLEAGLSLAQVAGDAISRTAIYFVETGKSKPSIETLRLIAERTGRPLDFFLSRPSTMEPRSSTRTAEVERLIATGDAAGALAAGRALLGDSQGAEMDARLKYLLATAHLRLTQPAEARRLASEARRYFEVAGDALMTAECLGSEASAAYLMQDQGALALAQRALETCRSLNPIPQTTEARLLMVLGGVYATNQDWAAAIDSYEQAIAAGAVVHDLRRLSLMYSGLSLAYQEVGNLNQAASYAHRALAIHETLDDRISLARSENNLGLVLVRRGDLEEGERHLRRSLRLWDESAIEAGKTNVLTSLSELSAARSDLGEAERYAFEALQVASRTAEPTGVADAHLWLGRIAEARGDESRSDAEFRLAFGVLEELGARERTTRAHVVYAEILENRGDLAGANRHLKQAIATSRTVLNAPQARESRSATA